MIDLAFRTVCLVVCALSMLQATSMLQGPAYGFEDPTFKDKASADGGSLQALDKTCVTCHTNMDPQAQHLWIGLHQASTYFGFDPTTATYIQDKKDIHAIALSKVYQNGDRNGPLTEPFELILGRLGIDKDSEGFRSQCLTCHAGLRADQSDLATPGRTYAQFQSEDEPIARESIGCEACHGQGKDYLVEHMYPSWLRTLPSDKLVKGFYDLENSAMAAQICSSCHQGNPEASKWVTHEMYAAGHPALPPMDLGKFLAQTPNRHWMTLNEKLQELAKLDSPIDRQLKNDRRMYLSNHLSTDDSDLNQAIGSHFRKTQQSRIGQWSANLIHHDLLDNLAQSEAHWGDYAVYDCAGCHQTLYEQVRGTAEFSGRVPGRPQGPLWTRPVLSKTGEPQGMQLVKLQGLIDEELNATPFGDRGRIHAAIDGFAGERAKARSQLIGMASEPLNPTLAEEWIRGFLKQRRSMLGNRWTANQTYWTMEMYFDDLENATKVIPQLEEKNRMHLTRFQELQSKAPRFFQAGSVRGPTELSRLKPTDASFYKELGEFIGEFLKADK